MAMGHDEDEGSADSDHDGGRDEETPNDDPEWHAARIKATLKFPRQAFQLDVEEPDVIFGPGHL